MRYTICLFLYLRKINATVTKTPFSLPYGTLLSVKKSSIPKQDARQLILVRV